MSGFTIKDSGERVQFDSGMVRDTQAGKMLYSLVFDGPMFKRWATHLTKGAVKYAARNWMKATGGAELDRFRESAIRHFVDWLDGKTDEDHAAGVFFNVNGAEYVKDRLVQERVMLYAPPAIVAEAQQQASNARVPCDRAKARGFSWMAACLYCNPPTKRDPK